jgi:hypothetical protein
VVVVMVVMPVVVMVMSVVPGGIVGAVARLCDARPADHDGSGHAEQRDCP